MCNCHDSYMNTMCMLTTGVSLFDTFYWCLLLQLLLLPHLLGQPLLLHDPKLSHQRVAPLCLAPDKHLQQAPQQLYPKPKPHLYTRNLRTECRGSQFLAAVDCAEAAQHMHDGMKDTVRVFTCCTEVNALMTTASNPDTSHIL